MLQNTLGQIITVLRCFVGSAMARILNYYVYATLPTSKATITVFRASFAYLAGIDDMALTLPSEDYILRMHAHWPHSESHPDCYLWRIPPLEPLQSDRSPLQLCLQERPQRLLGRRPEYLCLSEAGTSCLVNRAPLLQWRPKNRVLNLPQVSQRDSSTAQMVLLPLNIDQVKHSRHERIQARNL
jgi:hypothetical protein